MSASPSSGARSSRREGTLSDAFERSRTAHGMRTVRSWSENARVVAFVSACLGRLADIASRWPGGSVIWVAVSSRIDRSHAILVRWIRSSRGYRWLTSEPDPDVIVIDLRETWTVGPLIAVVGRLWAGFDRAAADSAVVSVGSGAIDRTLSAPIRVAGVAALGVSVLLAGSAIATGRINRMLVAVAVAVVGAVALFETRSWAELRETRIGTLFVSVFVPPEPPDSTDSDDDAGTDLNER